MATAQGPMKTLPKMPKATGKAKLKQESLPITGDHKPHHRDMKNSEADLIAKNRKLAAAHIAWRDEMDPAIAAMVVDGMEPGEILAMVREAYATAVNGVGGTQPGSDIPPQSASPAPSLDAPATEEVKGATLPAPPAVDFLSVPALAGSGDFAELALKIPAMSRAKAQAETDLKEAKAKVIGQARAANATKLTVAEWNVNVFEGGSSHIDGLKLIEKGVDPAIIKECTVKTKYWDVKVSPPGAPKGAGNGNE